jgi:hypothetical protein
MGSITKQDLRYYMRIAARFGVGAIEDLLLMRRLSIRLRTLATAQCERELTYREMQTQERLEKGCISIARRLDGLQDIEIHRDPRGPAVRLITKDGRELAIY